MRQMLIDRIELARRELKKVSGTPLTPEELEQQRREEAVATLEDFAYRLGMDCRMALYTQAVWVRGAAIEIRVSSSVQERTPETNFYLRPCGADEFQLFKEVPNGEPSELLLATAQRKDPQFANRVLVVIGDAMEKMKQGGPNTK
jgi:hypothetical protein